MYIRKVYFLTIVVVCFAIDKSFGYLTDEDIRCLISDDLGHTRPSIIGFSTELGEPSESVNILDVQIPIAFHHIIPFNVLRRFYTAVMASRDAALRQVFVSFLEGMADEYRIPVPAPNNPPNGNAVRDLNEVMLEEPNVEWIENGWEYTQLIRRLYTWMPFNIFEGPIPRYRDDDPGSGFEERSERIVGAQIFLELVRLHQNMLLYIRDGQSRDGEIAVVRLRDLWSQRNSPFLFNVHD